MKTKKEFNDPYYRTSSQSPKTIKETAVNSELKIDTAFVDIGQPAISTTEKTTIEPQRVEPSNTSTNVEKRKHPILKRAQPEIIKRAYSNKSISDWFEWFGAYNMLGEIGVWMT